MAIEHFKQTIWSKQIEKSLKTITSLRNHCSFRHQKETPNAHEIKILNVVAPKAKDYIPNVTKLEREHISDGSMTLKLDQMKYVDYDIDDVDKTQSVPGAMEETTTEAARILTQEGDKYVASLVKTATEDKENPLTQSATVIKANKTNIVESVEDGFAALYENNCPVNDTYYLELAPKNFSLFRQSLTELSTNNPEILKKGAVGKYSNAYVCVENLLPKSTDGTAVYNILRTDKAIDFVEQIDKVEAFRPHDSFADAIKMLYVFGALITRPKEIYVMKTAV